MAEAAPRSQGAPNRLGPQRRAERAPQRLQPRPLLLVPLQGAEVAPPQGAEVAGHGARRRREAVGLQQEAQVLGGRRGALPQEAEEQRAAPPHQARQDTAPAHGGPGSSSGPSAPSRQVTGRRRAIGSPVALS